MDCGIPYCHNGCPVNNQIPDWNDLVYRGQWKTAALNLHSTNNFPEVTGRVCPAPCEASCTLNIDDTPVTIKTIECAIADRAFKEGWIAPEPAETKTGKRIAIVGSGPAGLAAAQQLARAGHEVHVYEKSARPGGLLTYGIPDFKMEKHIVDRRVKQMEAEGVVFHCSVHVGKDVSAKAARRSSTTPLLLASGSEQPFDFFAKSPGRDLDGIHYAMAFLPQQNRRVSGEPQRDELQITAKDKHVIVIGGGDTGSDCIGTAFRQGARSVTQLEIMPMPPRDGEQGALLAALAAEAARVLEPGRGRQGRILDLDHRLWRQERQGRKAALHPCRQHPESRCRAARASCPPTSCCSPWASPGRSRATSSRSWVSPWFRAGASRGSMPPNATTASKAAARCRRRRHPPRPEPCRVGDPRGPSGRARHRPLSDGTQRSAALRVASRAAGLHARLANAPRFLPSCQRASRPRAGAGGRLEGHAWSER